MGKTIGKLVRRKTVSGKLIGPYLFVVKSSRWDTYVLNTTSKKKTLHYIQKKNMRIMKNLILPVESKTFNDIVRRKQRIINHSVTTKYNEVFTKDFDVIKLINAYGDYAYFKFVSAELKEDFETKKHYIHIYLGDLIYTDQYENT